MKNSTPLSFQVLIQNFFLKRLMQQSNVSAKTISSYRDTFRIYLMFLSKYYNTVASNVEINHLNREYVQKFIEYLEDNRGNKAATINNRLAAIKAFMKYVSEEAPEYSNIVRQTLMIPFQKQEKPMMCFITKDEFKSMTDCCDTSTAIGARDKLMLLLLYNTGARVSELLGVRHSDIIELDNVSHTYVKFYGKGRKERSVPIWRSTAVYLKKYVNTHKIQEDEYIFVNKNGDNLTRSGVRFRITHIAQKASVFSPTLAEKNITPHTFRHSSAMNLLQSGVDISTIAIWLGHSSIETTHKYMTANIEMKRKVMEKVGDMGNTSYKYKPSNDILNFLKSL